MTLEDKRIIASTAITLIRLLRSCDDSDYVDEVVECVQDGEIYPAIDLGLL